MSGTDIKPSGINTWKREPTQAPSARFGWHGTSRVWGYTASIAAAIVLLFMIIGNHRGKVEDIYLVGFAVALLAWVVRDWFFRRGHRG